MARARATLLLLHRQLPYEVTRAASWAGDQVEPRARSGSAQPSTHRPKP
jgi:hypothetical protein